MKISQTIQDAINKQINEEFFSSYQYLAMAAYFEDQNLKGFAHWMHLQADEEIKHGMKLYDYLIDRGGRVILTEIKNPKTSWNTTLEVIEEAYKNEQHVTELIYNLVNSANAEKDHATNVFLHWFVTEQVEEEDSANQLLDQVKLAGETGEGVFILDRELGKRTTNE